MPKRGTPKLMGGVAQCHITHISLIRFYSFSIYLISEYIYICWIWKVEIIFINNRNISNHREVPIFCQIRCRNVKHTCMNERLSHICLASNNPCFERNHFVFAFDLGFSLAFVHWRYFHLCVKRRLSSVLHYSLHCKGVVYFCC